MLTHGQRLLLAVLFVVGLAGVQGFLSSQEAGVLRGASDTTQADGCRDRDPQREPGGRLHPHLTAENEGFSHGISTPMQPLGLSPACHASAS